MDGVTASSLVGGERNHSKLVTLEVALVAQGASAVCLQVAAPTVSATNRWWVGKNTSSTS